MLWYYSLIQLTAAFRGILDYGTSQNMCKRTHTYTHTLTLTHTHIYLYTHLSDLWLVSQWASHTE